MDYFPIRRAARRREFEVMNAGQTRQRDVGGRMRRASAAGRYPSDDL